MLICSLGFQSCKNKSAESNNISLRLLWFPHSQFAGYIVALEKGYYKEVNLNVTLQPGGPDLSPTKSVASGSDDIGIAIPNQIIAAQSNGVPLVSIAQMFQDSPNRYILKKENQIENLSDLKGKPIGLWLGGDEVEFISMLKSQGMTEKDVKIIPQSYSVVPFLEDNYVCSMVTLYGEMNFLAAQGWTKDKFQILSPKDYNSAIYGDLIFCREDYLKNNKENVKKFLEASFKGWQYCISNPDEALKIVLNYNKELSEDEQKLVMQSIIELITSGDAQQYGLGYINPQVLENAERILYDSKQIENRVDVKKTYDASAIESIDISLKKTSN
jgi:NitT/TauT family transport system substrate-binding protein